MKSMPAGSSSWEKSIKSPVNTTRSADSGVGRLGHAPHDAVAGELADVEVGDLRDRQAVQVGRQAGDEHVNAADPELPELRDGPARRARRREGRQRHGRGGDQLTPRKRMPGRRLECRAAPPPAGAAPYLVARAHAPFV